MAPMIGGAALRVHHLSSTLSLLILPHPLRRARVARALAINPLALPSLVCVLNSCESDSDLNGSGGRNRPPLAGGPFCFVVDRR